MINLICAVLLSFGIYKITTRNHPSPYRPAQKVLALRLPKQNTQTEQLLAGMTKWLTPHIQLEPLKRTRLDALLRNLGHAQSPEECKARAVAEGILMACFFLWLPFLSLPLGLLAMGMTGVLFYQRTFKELQRAIQRKRGNIEKELPLFASTIRQNLNSTRDIVEILSSYRKMCGAALGEEIDKTLNDILTGNAQSAIASLDSRVGSPELGQLTRGLQATLRGDDQRLYFEILAEKYRKSQDERVEKELLNRPKQLYPYMGLLFACLVFMIIASAGVDMVEQMQQMF